MAALFLFSLATGWFIKDIDSPSCQSSPLAKVVMKEEEEKNI
jgi:hypothetical protein